MIQRPVKGRADTDEKKRVVIDRILTVWKRNPHLRLGQLLVNLTLPNIDAIDRLFYIEDEELVAILEKSA